MEDRRDEFHRRLLAESLSEQFGRALLVADPIAAEEIAREALELTDSEALLYELVVGPALQRIGRLWAAGEIGVGHEHLATQIATRVLVLAHEATGVAAARPGQLAMLAAVEGERHVVALDMAGKLLESAGFQVLVLGADMPTHELAAVVSDYRPTLFALSATMAESGAQVPAAVDAITAADARVSVIAGGTSVPPTLPLDPRVVIERSVAGVVATADRLVRRAGLN